MRTGPAGVRIFRMTGRRKPGSRGRVATAGEASRIPTRQSLTVADWCGQDLDVAGIAIAGATLLRDHGLVLEQDGLDQHPMAQLGMAGLGVEQPAGGTIRVRFPEVELTRLLSHVPKTLRLSGGTGNLPIEIGAGAAPPLLGPVCSADVIWSGRRERRALAVGDIRDVITVASALDQLTFGAGSLWLDCPNLAARDRIQAFATAGTQPLVAHLGGGLATLALIAVAKAVRPMSNGASTLLGIVDVDQALLVTADAMRSLSAMARAGDALVIAPTLILGANCPASVTGALVRFAAEVAGAAALAQAMCPGTAIVAGIRVAEASMRTGMPKVGTAASLRALAGAIEVARYMGLPVAALGPVTASKGLEAQAGTDTALWLSIAMAADIVLGAVGALELDTGVSLEKMLLDADVVASLLAGEPAGGSPLDWARSIAELGAGGIALGTAATRDMSARRRPARLADDWLYETWAAAGRPDVTDRAAAQVAELLTAGDGRAGAAPR